MGNCYTEHAENEALFHQELNGDAGNEGSTLTVCGISFPCTIDRIKDDWSLSAGKSRLTMVEECEFLAKDVPALVPNTSTPLVLDKGVQCQLKLNPNLPAKRFQFWDGGLLAGGLVYRYVLVDENFRG